MDDPPRTPADPLYRDPGWERERPWESAAGAGPESAEGWSERYGVPPPPPPRAGLDLSVLFALLDALRRAAPVELQERLTALIREALLTLRSLIDWYLERLDHPPREAHVEDIPID